MLAIVTKTNSVRCSMDFAMARQTLELKSSKNWSSSTADDTLAASSLSTPPLLLSIDCSCFPESSANNG